MEIVLHYKSHTVRYHKVVKLVIIDEHLRFATDDDDEFIISLNDTDLDFIAIDKSRKVV